MTYTVWIRNTVLGKAHAEGTYATADAAMEEARVKAKRARTFAYFEVWEGTPRNPIKPVPGMTVQGEC